MKWISHSRDEIKKGTICKRERIHICGLGASVGCERLSEHSTRRDESHRYGFFLFQSSSVLLFS
ncbi:hypothetical protein EUBHAL_00919 [Anaerobutyricum hallii DSM 3353]|uniref:Uncharacterized protein n=1 Tax=Anaerobutyricum hallii DSM 3353 TaxID=411469 RepID=C0EU35_9FIRM|nr:hypothetical protein EUBHAL_00919 [Anaerobutyricum hallii DSM 3353]